MVNNLPAIQETQVLSLGGERLEIRKFKKFKKIGNIKGTFHPKIGTIKDRNR